MNTKAYVILFSLFLAACGGGGSDSGVTEKSPEVAEVTDVNVVVEVPDAEVAAEAEVAEEAEVAGVWVGTVEFSGVTYTVTLDIVQGGTTLTATSASTSGTFAFNGSIDGSTIYLLSIDGDDKREYNLNLTSDVTVSGTFISTNTGSGATSTSPASFSQT
jgi:hypothetical protein